LLEDVAVPEAQDSESSAFEPLSAGLVVGQLFRVPVVSAVQLDHQTPVKADEIYDVPPQGLLPTESVAPLLASEPIPQFLLGLRL
jgi:hypothetical protein